MNLNYITTYRLTFLVSVWCILAGSFTPSNTLSLRTIASMEHSPVTTETSTLIKKVLNSFKTGGYVSQNATLEDLSYKIAPGQNFEGDMVLSIINDLLDVIHGKPSAEAPREEHHKRSPEEIGECKEALENLYELYYRFFIDYIARKSMMPDNARADLMHNLHAFYYFNQVTTPHDPFPLRLPLTRLLIKIFKLNREQRDIAVIESAPKKRKEVFSLINEFEKEASAIVHQASTKGINGADIIAKRLVKFAPTMQEHALDLNVWQDWIKRAKYTAGLVIPAALAYVIYNVTLGKKRYLEEVSTTMGNELQKRVESLMTKVVTPLLEKVKKDLQNEILPHLVKDTVMPQAEKALGNVVDQKLAPLVTNTLVPHLQRATENILAEANSRFIDKPESIKKWDDYWNEKTIKQRLTNFLKKVNLPFYKDFNELFSDGLKLLTNIQESDTLNDKALLKKNRDHFIHLNKEFIIFRFKRLTDKDPQFFKKHAQEEKHKKLETIAHKDEFILMPDDLEEAHTILQEFEDHLFPDKKLRPINLASSLNEDPKTVEAHLISYRDDYLQKEPMDAKLLLQIVIDLNGAFKKKQGVFDTKKKEHWSAHEKDKLLKVLYELISLIYQKEIQAINNREIKALGIEDPGSDHTILSKQQRIILLDSIILMETEGFGILPLLKQVRQFMHSASDKARVKELEEWCSDLEEKQKKTKDLIQKIERCRSLYTKHNSPPTLSSTVEALKKYTKIKFLSESELASGAKLLEEVEKALNEIDLASLSENYGRLETYWNVNGHFYTQNPEKLITGFWPIKTDHSKILIDAQNTFKSIKKDIQDPKKLLNNEEIIKKMHAALTKAYEMLQKDLPTIPQPPSLD